MTSLSARELRTIHETICRAEQVRKEGVKELSDLFVENPRLIITPNNKCAGACFHCVADSLPTGRTMSYKDFTSINPEFFEIFHVADFGRRGNPLIYQSNGHDIVDMMKFLKMHGIQKFTLALAMQGSAVHAIRRLEEFAADSRSEIETMVTYHHYHEGLDKTQLAREFNSTLKNYLGFSGKIIISLIGDEYSQNQQTKAEEVQRTFIANWKDIFADIELVQAGDSSYSAKYKNKETSVHIPSVDTRVYPLGRFRQYLTQRGLLEQYEKQFEQSMGDYVCPDLVKWPGIIIEPDGSLNLCGSFEAIACRGAVVTNIFTKPYKQVRDELMKFHKKETNWFIDNLQDIIAGRLSACKLKNNCYRK